MLVYSIVPAECILHEHVWGDLLVILTTSLLWVQEERERENSEDEKKLYKYFSSYPAVQCN